VIINTQTELTDLLQRVGHRPPKQGSKWICATCPPGKSPALTVTGEVWHCHRCQRGGDVRALRKELGITQAWTKEERSNFGKRKQEARRKALAFLLRFKQFRRGKI
jgi:hypothetical protein